MSIYDDVLRQPPATVDFYTRAADLLACFGQARDIWISESAEIHKNTLAQWARWSKP